ncbi:HlyD family secretion protein [Novosphingobium sp. AAP83]|uniref:HlyD family secretion protein n=1 Tax=Novosphingobium sp. AAP83 TaxID=1523425 RepID=UPI001E3D6F10|nr:HlyD family secretion protein [Novosphingobium sp. AAP83]
MSALALGAAYGAYSLYGYQTVGRFIQETDDAYVKADGVAVSSKLAGYVRAVPIGENQTVPAGGLLVQIDQSDFSTRLAQASAQVEVARATEAATLASINEAQSAVAQARAALAASQRDLTYLTGEVSRFRPLVASGAEPRQMLDQLLANRDKAVADVSAKQAMVSAASDRVVTARAQAGQSAAQIKAAQAQRDAAGNDLGTTRIIAPLAGRVGNSTVRVGQYVLPGQRLMTIVPTQALYVEANFKETQIGLMRPGQPVTIKVDALPDVDFHGTVESITPGTGANFSMIPPQNATGNFTKIVQRVPVRIRLNAGPESRKVLVPGLSLQVEVDTRSAKPALDAIRKEQEQVAK